MSKLGVHWIPIHGRTEDLAFIEQLQPRSVKLVDPDVQRVADVHRVAPQALIVVRDWALSEQKDDMRADPVGTGVRHARRWQEKLNEWEQQAHERGLVLPASVQLVCLGINEPQVWGDCDANAHPEQWKAEAQAYTQRVVAYTVAFLDELAAHGLRGGALNLSVGWPTNYGIADAAPDWSLYAPVHDALVRGQHVLFLHEYWPKDGIDAQWRWFAGRYTQCPWSDVQLIIGECGVEQRTVDGSIDQQKRGWRAWLKPGEYMAQLTMYDQRLGQDARVHSAQLFSTDGSRDWFESFDTQDIHALWLAYAKQPQTVTPVQFLKSTLAPGKAVHFLTVVNVRDMPGLVSRVLRQASVDEIDQLIGGPQGVDNLCWWQIAGGWIAETDAYGVKLIEEVVPLSDWQKAIRFVLRWEGGYVNDPNDPGGETNYGISKRSYPQLDIANLTLDQAVEIYQRDYWQASGADKLPWPLSLVHFDSAVNCGMAQANVWLQACGGSVTKYCGLRLQFYAQLSTWHFFGNAWVKRVADLMGQ
ncbi:MAG: glycosyl hydrolase 108 family protein [Caldilineaceae bacterium]